MSLEGIYEPDTETNPEEFKRMFEEENQYFLPDKFAKWPLTVNVQ